MKVDPTSFISDVKADSSVVIYKNCRISDTVLGDYSVIGDNSVLKESILGVRCQIGRNNMIQNGTFGDYSYSGSNLTALHSKIGKYCSISWNVSIGGANHDYSRVTTHAFLYNSSFGLVESPLYDRFTDECIIGNDVWIAAGVQILRGVKIGDGAVVAAGSVVTKDVEPYSIVAGVPAKLIKYRFKKDVIDKLLAIQWWNLDSKTIKDNIELFSLNPTLKVLKV